MGGRLISRTPTVSGFAAGRQQMRFTAKMPLAVGANLLSDKLSLYPAMTWDDGAAKSFPKSSLTELFKGRKVVLFAVPGAFTGVCQNSHVPSYASKVAEFKAKGV